MNTDYLEGKWKQYRGKIQEKWGKLTDDDLDQIAGKKDQLIGKIQERYGYHKEKVQEELADFEKQCCSNDKKDGGCGCK